MLLLGGLQALGGWLITTRSCCCTRWLFLALGSASLLLLLLLWRMLLLLLLVLVVLLFCCLSLLLLTLLEGGSLQRTLNLCGGGVCQVCGGVGRDTVGASCMQWCMQWCGLTMKVLRVKACCGCAVC